MSYTNICTISLRWILNVQNYGIHKIPNALLAKYVHGNVINNNPYCSSQIMERSHGDELQWIIQQARTIDAIGIDEWITTKDAQGYFLSTQK